jgi:hypothetical protein
MSGHIFLVLTGAKNVAHCANCSRFKIPPFNYYQTGIRLAYQCLALTCTSQVQGLIILEKILA